MAAQLSAAHSAWPTEFYKRTAESHYFSITVKDSRSSADRRTRATNSANSWAAFDTRPAKRFHRSISSRTAWVGLIVRSYLAGKQTQEGVFTPPADTKIRKIVFLGTPHFGSPATSLLGGVGGGDAQTDELQPGSPFVFDLGDLESGHRRPSRHRCDRRPRQCLERSLADECEIRRWRHNVDQRIARIRCSGAHAGNSLLPHRYCISALRRYNSKGNLADMNSAPITSPPRSCFPFLGDTAAWKTIGQPAAQNEFLSKNGGCCSG